MYFATPQPLRDPGSIAVPMSVTAVHRRIFDGSGEPGTMLEDFTSDLAALCGVTPRPEVLSRAHPSYSMMSDAMLHEATAGRTDRIPDLIVLAHSLPEVDPRRCVSTRLNHVSAGDPFGFGVSDQGTAAPFTALTLICEQMRAGCHRALLIVLEQAEVPYDTPTGTELPEWNSAVALLIESAGPARIVAVRQRNAVTAAELDAAVASVMAELPPGPPHPAVLGPARRVPGMLCTAPWWELADALDQQVQPHRTVLVDFEASLGCLSVLAVDTDADQAWVARSTSSA